jgi:hypothetical protein
MQSHRQLTLHDIDLSTLLFSAKIDYITIHTPEKTKLPRMTGRAIWPQKFHGQRLTVHDASPADVDTLIQLFGHAHIIELEIAIDLRPGSGVLPDDGENLLRSVMVELFARGLEPSAGAGMSNTFRAFYRRLESGYIVRPFNKGLPRPTDQQLNGGRDDAVQVKAYWKRRDQGAILPPDKQVARVEVRLGAQGLFALDLVTLASIQDFRFRKCLMPYFRHMRGTTRPVRVRSGASKSMLTLLADKQQEIDQEHWPQVGVGAFLRGGKRAGGHVRLMRNIPVNNRIGQALTRLEQQFQKTKFVRPDQSACEEGPILARLCGHPDQSRMTI